MTPAGVLQYNPYTFTGMVGNVRKYLPKEEGREGGEKRMQRASGGRGSKPRTYCMLDEGPQLPAKGVV